MFTTVFDGGREPANACQLAGAHEARLVQLPMAPAWFAALGASRPARAAPRRAESPAAAAAALRQAGNGEIMAMTLREAREQCEREYLLAQINRFGGNISRTASFVGMERSALHRKIKALGVNPNERGANERRANERGPTDRGQGPAA